MIPCHEAVQLLSETRQDAIVVNTMTPSRYWKDISDNPDYDLPIAGGMGKASSMALGLALSRPDKKIWCMDGDGSLLMNLGTLVTIAGQAPANLVHFVFGDEAYQTTGGQPVPGAGIYDFKTLAQGAGYPSAHLFDDLEHFKTELPTVLQDDGPIMVVLKIAYPDGGPSFSMANTKAAVARLRTALARDA
jgi:sulfopyruvate decarboxylase subunit beta